MKMTNIFIILGFIGAILVAISIAGYRYYSNKSSLKKHEETLEQSKEVKKKIDSNKEELKKGQTKIISEIKENANSSSQNRAEKIKIDKVEGDFVKGDKNIFINKKQKKIIKSILLETRITCGLKEGKETPPAEYRFIPVGDANSYFIGSSGKFGVEFLSPVRFRKLENGNIVINNRFITNNASDLLNKPISFLKNFNTLEVPIMTIIYGNYFDFLYQIELIIRINDEDVHYESWTYNNQQFQKGAINISLDNFKRKIIENDH